MPRSAFSRLGLRALSPSQSLVQTPEKAALELTHLLCARLAQAGQQELCGEEDARQEAEAEPADPTVDPHAHGQQDSVRRTPSHSSVPAAAAVRLRWPQLQGRRQAQRAARAGRECCPHCSLSMPGQSHCDAATRCWGSRTAMPCVSALQPSHAYGTTHRLMSATLACSYNSKRRHWRRTKIGL